LEPKTGQKSNFLGKKAQTLRFSKRGVGWLVGLDALLFGMYVRKNFSAYPVMFSQKYAYPHYIKDTSQIHIIRVSLLLPCGCRCKYSFTSTPTICHTCVGNRDLLVKSGGHDIAHCVAPPV